MDVSFFRIFKLIAELGNLTKVAEIVKLSPSSISRKVKELECQLGVRLLISSPHGTQLTEEGTWFSSRAEAISKEVEIAQTGIKNLRESDSGPLKIITTPLGTYFISPYLKEFNHLYPQVAITIAADDFRHLLYPTAASGVFVGLTSFKPPKDSSLLWIKLGSFGMYPYAHPDYLAQYGEPKTWEDLDQHKIIKYQWATDFSYIDDKKSNLLLYVGKPEDTPPRKHSAITDDIVGCRAMIESSLGVGLLPHFFARNSSLREIFSNKYNYTQGIVNNLYFVIPTYLKDNKRVIMLKDFLINRIENNLI